jgi:hypothetical protein
MHSGMKRPRFLDAPVKKQTVHVGDFNVPNLSGLFVSDMKEPLGWSAKIRELPGVWGPDEDDVWLPVWLHTIASEIWQLVKVGGCKLWRFPTDHWATGYMKMFENQPTTRGGRMATQLYIRAAMVLDETLRPCFPYPAPAFSNIADIVNKFVDAYRDEPVATANLQASRLYEEWTSGRFSESV